MAGFIQNCPHCNGQMGGYVIINSGLGPSTVSCHMTGDLVDTGRLEWAEMGAFRRAWYCFVSILYAFVFAGWGLMIISSFILPDSIKDSGSEPVTVAPLETRLLFLGGATALFVVGLGIQVARVRASLKRYAEGTMLTHRAARKFLYAQIATIILGVAIALIVGFATGKIS